MNGCTLRPVKLLPTLMTLLMLSALVFGAASANPLPAAALLVHVHPWTTNFCQTNTITQCSQVVQYSEIEGDVEFDLFLDNRYGFLGPFSEAMISFAWPQDWQFVSYEDCLGGNVTVTTGDHQAGLQIAYSPQVNPGTWRLIGRIRAQVNGFGGLNFQNVWLGDYLYGTVGPALAGVECTYSALSCSTLMPFCAARFTPDEVHLDVPGGGSSSTILEVRTGFDGPSICSVQFLETADWLEVDVAWDQYHEIGSMTVTANAVGLAEGDYAAVIRAVSQVLTCVPVTIHVSEVMAAPGPDPDAPTRTSSWGEIKQTFR